MNLLDFSLSESAFKRYNESKDRFEGKFLLSAYEAIGIGLGRTIADYDNLDLNESTKDLIVRKAIELWRHPEYQKKSGSGVRANFRIPVIIPLGEEIFHHENQN